MGLVTVFCPLTAIHTGAARLVVDCNVNPVATQVKMTLAPERVMVSSGAPPPQVGHGAVGMPS